VAEARRPRILDLFCGCGGLSRGFQKAGFDIVLGIDNWDVALATYRLNHHGSKTLKADLSSVTPAQVSQAMGVRPGDIDVVVGGPPCQGFSISGKRIVDDPRNRLYKSFVKFVSYYSPSALVMENVPNLISMDGGRIGRQIAEDFEAIGYSMSHQVLLASDFGVPQNRRRIFFVGLKNGARFVFPEPTHGGQGLPRVTCKEAISDLPEGDVADGTRYPVTAQSGYQERMRNDTLGIYNHETIKHTDRTRRIISLVPDGGNFKDLAPELQNTRKVNIAWTRFRSDRPSSTIDTGHNHIFHYKYDRVPTARESARLQSFDDSFIFLGKKNEQIKQIGNAVPPLLARAVARRLGGQIHE